MPDRSDREKLGAVFRFFLPLVVLGCASCSSHALEQIEAACEVALVHVKLEHEEAGKPVAIDAGWRLGPTRQELETFLEQQPKWRRDPELPLHITATKVRQLNVIKTCPDLRKWLPEGAVLRSAQQVSEVTREEPWPVVLLQFDFPAISEDGSTALIHSSVGFAPEAGYYGVVLYNKDRRGVWRRSRVDVIAMA